MQQRVHRYGSNYRSVVFGAIAIAFGAIGGIAATPAQVRAAAPDATYKCVAMYECGAGDKECCRAGGGEVSCSTTCVIIVT